jgi:1-acyl-sn-glycerol-3-phosphate acyltransferase
MLEPTPEQLASLQGFERTAFRVCHEVNRRPILKRMAHGYLRSIGASWVHLCTRNLLHVTGLEHVSSITPDRGVMIVSNHRSFFDLYVVTSAVLRSTPWVQRMYFPVRSSYFYERVDGIFVNLAMSALAMYPTIMRESSKRRFNQYAVDVLASVAATPGTIVGMHPEGTRSKTEDPYTLLPAQPGVGQVVHAARPIVVPVFILGLGNDLVKQIKGNFDGSGEPITMVFGEPIDLREQLASPPRLRTFKKISDQLRDEITRLGEQERELRRSQGLPPKGAKRQEARPVSHEAA